MATLTLELEEVKVHANDEAAQKAVLREELRRREAVSRHLTRLHQHDVCVLHT